MSVKSAVRQHSTIGPIRGIHKIPGVTQFLGVQYASFRDRFSRAELLKSYPPDHASVQDGVFDATRIGPIPLSPLNGCQWEHSLIQRSLPCATFEQSDTECLTLNITVPNIKSAGAVWPVLALVHGGAFATGSSSYPQYDLGRIVQKSVETGKPIIAVGINYRLGVPGFLHSSAMKAAGYKPNNGLHDQRLGLLWIKHHIAGFNGDPEHVTFIGESSGAASGTFHLHSTEPLFSQLVTMSGTSLIKAKPAELGEKSFGAIVELLSADHSSPVPQLLATSMEDIREKVGRKVPLAPLVDGELIPGKTIFATMTDRTETAKLFPGQKWCRRILMGDCQMDGSAYAPRLANRSDILPKTLADNLAAKLDPIDPTLTPAVVAGYGLDTLGTANTPESTKAVLDLATDICFGLGARTFTRAWSSAGEEAFLYRFNVPNPWEGPWKGHASHILDIAFVLQNYREQLPAGQQKTGDRFTTDVIDFVNGGSPWSIYRNGIEEGSMVYYASEQGEEDESGYASDEAPEKTGRRDVLQKLMKQELLDKVMEAWEMTMKGPAPK